MSDNSSQFAHCTISPGNSKANGKVESAVKIAKRLLCKALKASTDWYRVTLDYRNMATQGVGSNPAQRLMSRRTKTHLPTMNQLLQPQASKPADDRARLIERQHKQKWYHNRSTKYLKPFEKGNAVRMRPLRPDEEEWRKALVVDRHGQRSYTVATSDGGTYRRDRVHLRKTQEPPPIIQQNDGSTLPSNPTSLKPAENCNRPADEDARQNRQTQAAGSQWEPLPTTERPSRARRPQERLKECVCF